MSSESAAEDRVWQLLSRCRELDVDGLTESAQRSFSVLERWYLAQQ